MSGAWSGRWHEYFMDIAERTARMSKDPSTQCGAVIVRPNKTIASMGYNGFPRAIHDAAELLVNRPAKYKRVIHAEMNAILTAREPLEGYSLYVWPFPSCERCAVHIIQAGITSVLFPGVPDSLQDRWAESIEVSMALYEEADVGTIVFDPISEDELRSQAIVQP